MAGFLHGHATFHRCKGLLAFASLFFGELNATAGTLVINGGVGNFHITSDDVLVAQVFINISCGNLACGNGANNGSRTGYAVTTSENAFVVGQLAAGQGGDGATLNLDACLLKGTQHNALADSYNDDIAGDAL